MTEQERTNAEVDPELKALAKIVATLEPLTEEARRRVIQCIYILRGYRP